MFSCSMGIHLSCKLIKILKPLNFVRDYSLSHMSSKNISVNGTSLFCFPLKLEVYAVAVSTAVH